MKFIVRRTSQHRYYDEDDPGSTPPPIPGAVRVSDGGYWTTEEIDTLEDLLELAKRLGENLIVKAQGTNDEYDDVPGLSEVEIYDDHRE